jgi:hypothetical protein
MRLDETLEARAYRIERIRAQVRNGTYDDAAKLDAAIDKLIDEHLPAPSLATLGSGDYDRAHATLLWEWARLKMERWRHDPPKVRMTMEEAEIIAERWDGMS